jgi:2-polyprenyl-6-methoxyphenol hydroxylase-like FAD-dependent oxidoreductase
MKDAEVLVVGAGPTGLVLALSLARQGLGPRIVEKSPGPGEASRAMAVHARTLELYRQLGIADEVVRRGIKVERIHLREGSREVARLEFGDIGEGLSPYPFVLSFPQDDHERLLVEQLAAAGVEVEWDTELVDFADEGGRVRATLRKNGAVETAGAAYLCGCDGAGSSVRQGLGLDFPGGTYRQVFFVADVEAEGGAADNDDLNACLSSNGFVLVFPVRSSGMHRVIGIVPEELETREGLTFEDVRPFLERQIDVRVRAVNWFSRYLSHHRVADRFRVGRSFLAGDAGHIHSPAGGQGMNTGIGDAVNLAWKLAAVVDGRADASILDTYEPERIAFARTLVATTDKAFHLVAGQGAGSRVVRELFPHIAPFVTGFTGVRRAMFRTVSQTRINYRHSSLSAGSAGDVEGGDRLPWVEGLDNFAPLGTLDWQAHVYGAAGEPLREASRALRIPLHEFPWTEAAGEVGLERDALYLVRPDGYVALADREQGAEALRAFVALFAIVPRHQSRSR